MLREGMTYPITRYFKKYFVHLLIAAIAFILGNLFIDQLQYFEGTSESWTDFIADSFFSASIYALVLFGLMYLCLNSFRQFLNRLKKFIHL